MADVFNGPLAGSPKFQLQLLIVPAPAGMVEAPLLNAIEFFSQVIVAILIFAEAVSQTVMVCDTESRQPPAVAIYKYLMVLVLPGITELGVKIPVGETPVPL